MEILRRLGPDERLRIAISMSEAARELSLSGIMLRNPSLTRHEAIITLAGQLYGIDLARRAWGAAADRCFPTAHGEPEQGDL
jgi:hypothetical protein